MSPIREVVRLATGLVGVGAMLILLVLPPGGSAGTRPVPAPGPGTDRVAQPLRALARPVDLYIGTAVNMDWLPVQAEYRDRIGTEFSSVTPESVMKWRVVEPVRGQLDYSDADALVEFAREHGQRVRGHTLVWHDELPAWLTGGSFTTDQLRQILRQHVIDEVTHFRGKVAEWDVVNEALDEDGSLRDTIWLRNLGPGYLADAFRWAHQADPGARLFYNDNTIEQVNPKSDSALALVRQLRAQGVPIDGVGFQSHLVLGAPVPSSFQQNLGRFSALGLAVEITEADVRVPLPVDAAKLDAQAGLYQMLVGACLHTTRCTGVTVWGFTDQHSWVAGGLFPGYGAADLLDAGFRPKPAYYAVAADLFVAGGPGGDPLTRTYFPR